MKCQVIGDSTNRPRYSTNIIVESLNAALSKLDLYGDNKIIKYDALCQTHGDKIDAYISTYELSFPRIILDNAAGKPILGVSLHNWNNILDGGHEGKSDYFSLGVDTSFYPLVKKTKNLNQIVFALYSESLVRGGFETVIQSFARHYEGSKDAKLIIKDRNATPLFKEYVEAIKIHYEVDVEYINEHWDSKHQIIDFAEKFDIYINTNRCSTFNMPVLEMMSMGKPSIITNYSGPADFCLDNFNCVTPKFEVSPVDVELPYLTTLGCRNFFFTQGYKNIPVWATTDQNNLIDKMKLLEENNDLREKISKNARLTAEKLTWEKSALNMYHVLGKLL